MIRQLPFRRAVSSGKGVRLSTKIEYNGYIRAVLIHWPDGCNSLVEIRVGVGTTQIVPTEDGEYLALNNATIIFPPSPMMFNEKVVGGNRLWIEIKNGDDTESHTVSVVVFIEEGN